MMRFHSQTAGVTLTAQQPMNNIVRVAYQAMAAVLGGTQSLHTNSMDETLALPTEESVQVALRTQQVLAYETGVPNVMDPLGGSYYVEALTSQLESESESLFTQIEEVGGVVRGLETGWLQRRIAESAARQQWEIEQHRRVIVGVNEFVTDEPELTIPILKIGEQVEREQRQRMAKMRAEREGKPVEDILKARFATIPTGRAGDPLPQRPPDRVRAGGRVGARRAAGGLRADASAVGGQSAVRAVARGALPGPQAAGDEPDQRDARRKELRRELRQANDG